MASISCLKNAPLKDKLPRCWDVLICQQGEANLYENFKSCQKNPDHKGFIPVDAFDITHLPTDYQDKDIVEYIKLVAQLTVRLTVRYVSPNRPATIPGTDTPYPGFQNKGTNGMRVGTGLMTSLHELHSSDEFMLNLTTATHVVFDRLEVQNAACDLFFDNENVPEMCLTAYKLPLTDEFIEVNTVTDECIIGIRLADLVLAEKLKPVFSRLLQLKSIIGERFFKLSDSSRQYPLTFIVSHPHGCSKTISIGRCMEVDDNLDDVRFLYTTPTCPGSSGAAVVCLDKQAWYLDNIHCGPWQEDKDLNLSSGRYCRSTSFLDLDWQIFFSPGNLEQRYQHDFRLANKWNAPWSLPSEYHHNMVLDYIRAWANICVNVEVKYVSQQRPEFWPGSKLPYPSYEERGSREERSGCGWVDRVEIYPNQSSPNKACDCVSCRNSSTAETNFAHIFILTSTSLVFDQSEGRETNCWLYHRDLYFKSKRLEESSLIEPVCSDVETDKSQIVFVTHDLILAGKYKTLLAHLVLLKEKILGKIPQQTPENQISIKFGRYGNVTTGRFVKEDKDLVYTNTTQGDDVGAPVILLGDKYLQSDVVGHTGQYPHDSKRGYSRHLH